MKEDVVANVFFQSHYEISLNNSMGNACQYNDSSSFFRKKRKRGRFAWMNQDVISVLQLSRKKVVGIYDSIEKVNHGIISKINYPED